MQADTGRRRVRTGYIELGKGNGKTALGAAMCLYALLEGEPGAEVYSAATTRDQAKLAWRDATRMVEGSPLADGVRVMANSIVEQHGHGFFKPVSSEHKSLDGLRVHVALIDELHECNQQVVERVRAGTKGRRQPLLLEITNSGYDLSSICYQHHDYSLRVLGEAQANDTWFAYVAALDPDDAPFTDPACWVKANPNLGVSLPTSYLEEQVAEARGMPAKEASTLRLNFCQWTRAKVSAIEPRAWGALPELATVEGELSGAALYLGLDLGLSRDFSSLAMLYVLPGEPTRYAARVRSWLPEAALSVAHSRPYDAWQAKGLLALSDGEVTDYHQIKREILDLHQAHPLGVRELAFDRRFASHLIQDIVAESGDILAVDMPQGFQLNQACVRLGELLAERQLYVDGDDDLLAWMATNLVWRQGRYGEQRPDKEASTESIDGVVALLMALQRAIVPDEASDQVYEDRGVLTL